MNSGVAAARVELEALYARWAESEKSRARAWPETFRCPRDCCECCRTASSVPVTAIEANRIAEAIDRLPDTARSRAILAVRELASAAERGPIRGRACPLLDGFKCSIYEDRPLVCRAYGFAAEADGSYFGCEVLLPELRAMDTVELPLLCAAKERLPAAEVLDREGRAIPDVGPLVEMVARLVR